MNNNSNMDTHTDPRPDTDADTNVDINQPTNEGAETTTAVYKDCSQGPVNQTYEAFLRSLTEETQTVNALFTLFTQKGFMSLDYCLRNSRAERDYICDLLSTITADLKACQARVSVNSDPVMKSHIKDIWETVPKLRSASNSVFNKLYQCRYEDADLTCNPEHKSFDEFPQRLAKYILKNVPDTADNEDYYSNLSDQQRQPVRINIARRNRRQYEAKLGPQTPHWRVGKSEDMAQKAAEMHLHDTFPYTCPCDGCDSLDNVLMYSTHATVGKHIVIEHESKMPPSCPLCPVGDAQADEVMKMDDRDGNG
ncbi:hypothetical protein B0T17DRAFT_616533 [Bombardia bombarda]|uniref:Uncharacterized protein n=1 Tax=Bombardia bombarda TaxID=252184 RepID=A0AA39XBM9_9PEZI|nr:hypothetical protein B0T17DRAFT_616533 [Bombardia bombarda]